MPRDRDSDSAHPQHRREPLAGRVDGLRFDRPPPRADPPPRMEAWIWLAAAGAALLLVLALWFRQPLADYLWPQTRAQGLREQAAQALAQGRLTAADGTGARELYEAALAMDPDRTGARDGLMQVAQAALAQARTAIAQERFADAHAALRLARELSVPRAQADAVAASLREREAARAGIEQLLARAARARREHRLIGGADAALPLYRRVLALQPERVEALEGREDALADLLQAARKSLRDGDLAAAAAAVAAARRYDAGHADLPQTQDALAHALDAARERADDQRRAGHLQRAEAAYRALLAIAADDPALRAGLEQVGAAWARRAQRFAADFRFADAGQALAHAQRLDPKAAATAAQHVERARQAKARLGSTLSTAERRRRVAALLAAAAAAQARGDLLAPPGDSAFDKLRAARAIAPDDAEVRRASARLLPAARACFEDALRGNDLTRAGACLDARELLDSDGVALARARRRLAERWLAYGDERLGAGELQRAQAALKAARARDPATPGLAAFANRVRAAQPSAD